MKAILILGAVCLLATVWAKEDKKDKDDVGTVIGIDLGTTYSWYVFQKFHCYLYTRTSELYL